VYDLFSILPSFSKIYP